MNVQTSLWQRRQAIHASADEMDAADVAALLGVAEATLAAADPASRRLKPDWRALLDAAAALGVLRVVTGNHVATLEQTGCYSGFSVSDDVGLMLNPGGIDLRFFLRHWQSAYAVDGARAAGRLGPSLQFFDAYGDAVHKLYLLDADSRVRWLGLADTLGWNDPEVVELLPPPAQEEAGVPVDFDRAIFERDWLALDNVHRFNGLLQRHRLSRRQAFLLAPAGSAERLANEAAVELLQQARQRRTVIMAFVCSRGTVQIFTGQISAVEVSADWLIADNHDARLRLRRAGIAEIWRVRRPTRDGSVTSVELLDSRGRTLVTYFGQRREGMPERTDWRALADGLPMAGSGHDG
jgi:putative hemin transport protein